MRKAICLFAFVAVLASISCKKDNPTPGSSNTNNNNNNNNNNTVTVNSTPQFTGTIGGTAYSYVTGTVYSGGTSSSKSLGGNPNTATYQTYMNNTSSGQPFLGITKGTLTLTQGNFADTASLDAFFAPGTYSYSASNGIVIQWLDASGNVYSTAQGSGVQTGSVFKITAKRAQGLVYGTYQVATMATFNCTLYSISGTAVVLTNGVYVGVFGND